MVVSISKYMFSEQRRVGGFTVFNENKMFDFLPEGPQLKCPDWLVQSLSNWMTDPQAPAR